MLLNTRCPCTHKMDSLIHHWLSALGLSGGAAVWIGIRAGLFDKAGEYIFEKWLQPVLDKTRIFKGWGRKRKKKETSKVIKIAALTQKVSDYGQQLKQANYRLTKVEKNLVKCQAERTECRADLKNLLFRVVALEKRKAS
jgi:hypothetical protein